MELLSVNSAHRMGRPAIALCLLLGTISCSVHGEEVALPWLGANLAPNPGFEIADEKNAKMPAHWEFNRTDPGKGANAILDSEVKLQGHYSARVTTMLSGVWTQLASELIRVDPGDAYFLAASFRQEGFTTRTDGKPQHSGVGSYPRLYWFDADKRPLNKFSVSISAYPYGPSPWDIRDAIEVAPPRARYVRLGFQLSNQSMGTAGRDIPSTMWIDNVQFRRYASPPTPDWATGQAKRIVDGASDASPFETYFSASDRTFTQRGGKWSRIVTDPKAERGSALESPPGVGKGIMSHGPYNPHLPAGMSVYRLRVRAAATTEAPPDKRLGFVDVNTERSALRLLLPIYRKPDTPLGDYAVYEGDFILRDNGWWNVRLYTDGDEPWRIESVRVIPLFKLADRQLSALYPSSIDELSDSLVPPSYYQPGGTSWLKGLIIGGIGFDWYRLSESFSLLKQEVEITAKWVKKGRSAVIMGLPESPAELFNYPLICLCNVRIDALPLAYRRAILAYVQRGGALVVMAGHQSYERGALQGSWIEEVLPVIAAPAIAEGYLHSARGWQLKPEPGTDWLGWIGEAPGLTAYTMHRVRLKPGAKVFIQAGGHPFAVGGTYGKGRVVCILAQATGSPSNGPSSKQQIPFWRWNGWPEMMRDLTWWALRVPFKKADP